MKSNDPEEFRVAINELNKDEYINKTLTEDLELAELMYYNCSDWIRKEYLSWFKPVKVIKVPKEVALIIKMFDGVPWKPRFNILIEFNRGQFVIRDYAWEAIVNEQKEKLKKLQETQNLVLGKDDSIPF